jgi:sterol 3beta-glucosyltransferase
LCHGWLFPRCAGVVHHGGSGTTGFALRSGRPSLVVPFGFDQHYWGARTCALGAGPAPQPFRTLSAEGLAAAFDRLARDAALRRGAAALGQRLAAERGVERAVDTIEGLGARGR